MSDCHGWRRQPKAMHCKQWPVGRWDAARLCLTDKCTVAAAVDGKVTLDARCMPDAVLHLFGLVNWENGAPSVVGELSERVGA